MTMVLVDVKNAEFRTVKAAELKDFYKLIGCKTVDIVRRKIGGKSYSIICDDEGALIEDRIISSVNSSGEVMFYGNLLIAGEADIEGELTELSEEDIYLIKNNKTFLLRIHRDLIYPVVITEWN